MLLKADLHSHHEWSARLDRVRARQMGYAPFDWTAWRRALTADVPPGLARLQRLSRIYPAPAAADTDEAFIDRVTDALCDFASAEACYAELRFGHDSLLRPGFMDLFRQAESRVRQRYPLFQAEPVASLLLWRDVDHLDKVVAACLAAAHDGLAGVDLLNVPYAFEADWRSARAVVDASRAAGLGVTVHAGEFSTANIAAVAGIDGVSRIGHATQAAKDPWLLDLLAGKEITVEVCLTGNVVLGAVDALPRHPLRGFLDAGINVVLGTDNPVQFGTTIAEEYRLAAELGLSDAELRQITRHAVDAAFTTAPRKQRLHSAIDAHSGVAVTS